MEDFTKIGEFQHFEHPPHAEKFTKSDYCFTYHVASNLLPGKLAKKEAFHCPTYKCDAMMDVPEHGDAYKCNGCGIKLQTYGNALYLWR